MMYVMNGRWVFKLSVLLALQVDFQALNSSDLQFFAVSGADCMSLLCSRKWREIKLTFLTVLQGQMQTGQILRKRSNTII